jgi:hypothetical protein
VRTLRQPGAKAIFLHWLARQGPRAPKGALSASMLAFRESPPSGLSEPRVGLDYNLFFFLLFFLFRIFVVVFVSAPSSASICSPSLCLPLAHYYLSVSLYISLSSLRISPRASLEKSGDKCKADSTLRTSRAIPHPSSNRVLCRLTSEVERDPVHTVWPSANMLMMMSRAIEMKGPWHSIITRLWEALYE